VTTTKRRGGARARVTTVTREGILTALQLAGRPVSLGEIYPLVDIDPDNVRERKAVQNRLPPLVAEGKVRKSGKGMGSRMTYEAVDKAPPGAALVPVPAVPVRQAAAIREARTNGHRAPLSVEDACVGMLLGMTGRESVPIRRLPEINAWMRETAELLESLR